YTIDPAKANALNDNQTEQEVFTLTASDGTVQQITVDVTGADDAAVITGDSTASITEDVGAQTASGTITITDADTGDTPTIPNGTLAGEYGSLTLVDGAWTYTVDTDAVQSLGDGDSATDTITVTASDGSTQDIVISLTGTDDAAEISGTVVGTIDAESLTNTREVGENLLVNGNFESFGNNESVEWTTLTSEQIPGWYTPDGAVIEVQQGTMDGAPTNANNNSVMELDAYHNTTVQQDVNVSALAQNGDSTLSLSFDYASRLSNTSQFEVTVFDQDGKVLFTQFFDNQQANDHYENVQADFSLPSGTDSVTLSISGQGESDSIGALIDNVSLNPVTFDNALLTTSGSITISDVDEGDSPEFENTSITGTYGTLVLVDGQWTYTLDPQKSAELSEGETAQDVITLTASDGTTQDIIITVLGDNDVSSIIGNTTGEVIEGNVGDVITTSGTLTVSDIDNDAATIPDGTQTGQFGTLSIVNGEWTYTLNNEKADTLNEDQSANDTFTVTTSDGTTQDININITGSNDAAVLSGTSTASITDTSASSQNVTVGRGSDGTWDASNGDNLYLNLNNVNSDAAYSNSVGYYVLDAGGNVVRAAIIFDNAHSTNGTSVNINTSGGEKVGLFMIPDGDSKGFNVGSVSLSFGGSSVTAYQGGASSTTFVSDSSKNSGYDNEYNSGTYSAWEDIAGGGDRDHNDVTFYVSATQQQESPITASGSVSVSDVDSGDTPTLPNTTVQGEFGSLTMTNGNWTYTFDPDKASAIDEETLETIVITDSEGGKHEIVIAIQGTDDAPIVTGVFSGAVTEGDADDVITVSGTISISDADADDSPDFENTTIDGQYGSLTLADGEWTYTLDPVKSQVLSETDFVQDTITLTATDGTTQNVVISVTGTDDAPFVVGTNSATIIAPDSATQDYIDINNGFVLGDGYSFSGGDMQYYGNEPTLTFNDSGSTIRIYDTDSRMDGDAYSNEYVQDSSQKVEINGVLYTATYDYQLDYQDSSGNIYSFAVLDVDLDRDGGYEYDANEQGKVIIQIDGPTITPGISMEYIRDTPNQPSSMSYSDFVDGDVASLEAHGTLSVLDVDANDSQAVFADTTVTGQYGSLELVDGNWTYTLDPRSTPALGDNDAITEVITLTATNGAQTEVNVTIGGSENAIANASLSGLSQSLSDVISLDDVTFSGSDSNDRIAGSDSADVLLGNAGHDVILGGSGNDFIDGGLGDDLILGGQGNDLMAGGAGSDTFAFLNGDQSTSSTPTVDHIADFDTSQDAINLSDLMQTEPSDTLESFLSLIDDGEGNAMLNIASQGDGNVDQQVVFDNMSVEDMASAYSVDISGMTSEQVSTSVIDAMIMQSKMIID
ncbi:VCBS domain-containing protein, partial [Enterovibrio norvegicus]|uniref:VCBS domain-containing protein n=3 Tax=Enterovibrio TaxID=188143 RepID=UPI000378296D